MKTRTQIRLLYVLAACFFVVGVLVMWNRFFSPPAVFDLKKSKPAPTLASPAPSTPSISLVDFEPLWDKRLQGKPREPLEEKSQIAKQEKSKQNRVAVPEVQLPAMDLTGIFHSPKFALATFEVDGKPVSATIGEFVNGAMVKEISRANVTLTYQKKTFVQEIK